MPISQFLCQKCSVQERNTFSSFLFLVFYLFKKIILLQLLHKGPGEAERWMCKVRTDKGINFLPRVDWRGYHMLHPCSHTHLSSVPALSSTSSWSIKRCGHVAYLRGRWESKWVMRSRAELGAFEVGAHSAIVKQFLFQHIVNTFP